MSEEEKKQSNSLWRVLFKILFGLAVVCLLFAINMAPPVGNNLSNTFSGIAKDLK